MDVAINGTQSSGDGPLATKEESISEKISKITL